MRSHGPPPSKPSPGRKLVRFVSRWPRPTPKIPPTERSLRVDCFRPGCRLSRFRLTRPKAALCGDPSEQRKVTYSRTRPQAAPRDRPLTGGPEWAVPLLDFGETGLAVASTAMLRPPTAAPCVSARRALNHVRRIANRCQSSSIAGRVHARAEATHRSNAEVGLPHGELAISLPMRRSPRS